MKSKAIWTWCAATICTCGSALAIEARGAEAEAPAEPAPSGLLPGSAAIVRPGDTLPPSPVKPIAPPPDASGAGSSGLNVAALSGTDLRFWQQNWKRVAMGYALIEDRYYGFPNFDPKFASSAKMSVQAWSEQNTDSSRVSEGGFIKTVRHAPPREEAVAAATRLPEFVPGAYGFIDSAKVVQVVGPLEMVVTDIQLVDAKEVADAKEKLAKFKQAAEARIADLRRIESEDRQRERSRNNVSGASTGQNQSEAEARSRRREQSARDTADLREYVKRAEADFTVREKLSELQAKSAGMRLRVLGFPTGRVAAGDRWKIGGENGAQIILFADPTPASSAESNPAPRLGFRSARTQGPALGAIAAESLAKPMTEAQFVKLVGDCGMSPAQWCEFTREIMKRNTGVEDDRPAVIAGMETARKKVAAEEAAEARKLGVGDKPDGAAGDKPAANTKASDWFRKKYEKKDEAEPGDEKPAVEGDTGPEKPGESSGASSGDEAGEKPASKGSDWFKKKYEKKKPAEPQGEGESSGEKAAEI